MNRVCGASLVSPHVKDFNTKKGLTVARPLESIDEPFDLVCALQQKAVSMPSFISLSMIISTMKRYIAKLSVQSATKPCDVRREDLIPLKKNAGWLKTVSSQHASSKKKCGRLTVR